MANEGSGNPKRIGITGRSFGSFFATIAAAGEPRYRGCAVSGTCLEPGCGTLFGAAPPTFKRRFMYMSGYTDEAKFDRFCRTLTWEGHAERIRAAYLCVTGEFDALSPLAHTERMMAVLRCAKQLIVYQGAGHSASGTPSTALGPFYPGYMADWMNARFAGEQLASERWFVDHSGRIERTAYR